MAELTDEQKKAAREAWHSVTLFNGKDNEIYQRAFAVYAAGLRDAQKWSNERLENAANELDQLFRQRHTRRDVIAVLRSILPPLPRDPTD